MWHRKAQDQDVTKLALKQPLSLKALNFDIHKILSDFVFLLSWQIIIHKTGIDRISCSRRNHYGRKSIFVH